MAGKTKIWLFLIFLIAIYSSAKATHNRAGEITYRHISGYTYEFTVTTYTYKPSKANRDRLDISWGDGTSQTVYRRDTLSLPNQYLYSSFIAEHTFPGAGIYEIFMEDPNRNLGVKNIPNSVNVVFSIKTTMLIGPFTGSNSTPILLNPPIDKAAKGHIFIHNPAAYDPDGDSISYELTICTAENGKPIQGYTFPPASDTLYINSNGDLTWLTPVDTGTYNVAMFIDEWRNGVRIGRITRDMQIDVYETDNNPPVNDIIPDLCIEAGDTLIWDIYSTDADNDFITMEMVAGPIADELAEFEIIETEAGKTHGRLTWNTNCGYAQNQPYTFVLKSQDIVSDDISLVDITSFKIRVLHNEPENLQLLPGADTIRLVWDVSNCGNPAGYHIYRKIDYYGFSPDSCEVGVPEYTGYELLDDVEGRYTNYYTDDNHGKGMVPGFDYCYMITAYYSDNAESFATPEVCTTLVPGVPAMLQVSVEEDSETNGEILVSWAYPYGIDTIVSGPYQYRVFRLNPGSSIYEQVAAINTDLSDTTYIDTGINTLVYPYFYSVKLFYQDGGTWAEYPGSEIASSLYLGLYGSDNAITIEHNKRSPWQNYRYDVFRKSESSTVFDFIGFTVSSTFFNDSIPNQVRYDYKSSGLGMRPLYGHNYYMINQSHINSAEAIDTVPPCAPVSQVISICDSSYNILSWISPEFLCNERDIVQYQIYYSSTLEGDMQLIGTRVHPDTTFIHNIDLVTLAGVYGVAAVDSFNNVSSIIPVIIDSCIMYKLPNVFSPNNDGTNDIYLSYNLGDFVQRVDMKIFNRYGQLVYNTDNPDIRWDGRNKMTGRIVSPGVYYYICDVYEPRLTGEEHRGLKGFIHVYAGENNIKAGE
ncbi:MAG: gliding motility-associated C-terminal domain-containing protein [Bacteroidales bacterium]|nr:gliding motility-associated C-terminal domain-containing protein [Bacteroidales bacterium]MBN2817895.1 gliding motility-associated C-terminal domain-containing protein [Bacteroidales bacterium]